MLLLSFSSHTLNQKSSLETPDDKDRISIVTLHHHCGVTTVDLYVSTLIYTNFLSRVSSHPVSSDNLYTSHYVWTLDFVIAILCS